MTWGRGSGIGVLEVESGDFQGVGDVVSSTGYTDKLTCENSSNSALLVYSFYTSTWYFNKAVLYKDEQEKYFLSKLWHIY